MALLEGRNDLVTEGLVVMLVWCPLVCCLISYFSTHNSHRVHFTLWLLVSGKDDTEDDVDVESMYPLVAFFDLFCLEEVVDVDDSASDAGFFALLVRLLFLVIFGELVSGSVSGSIAA